jgi:hypothetical protein
VTHILLGPLERANLIHWTIIVPVHKKGDKTDCNNYRGISLISTSYQILPNILLSRLSPYTDKISGDHQCGIRRNRSITEQIFFILHILEKKWEYNETVHQLFGDFNRGGKYCTVFSYNLGYPWN